MTHTHILSSKPIIENPLNEGIVSDDEIATPKSIPETFGPLYHDPKRSETGRGRCQLLYQSQSCSPIHHEELQHHLPGPI
jgi:hypothetical protein